MVPLSFMDFLSLFELVSSSSVFFVILPASVIGIAISVDNFSVSFNFVIAEIAFNDLVQSLQLESSLSVSFSFGKLAGVDISVTVLDGALTLEMSVLELTFVFFLSEGVDSPPMFMVVFEVTFIGSSVGLSNDSFAMFHAISKFSLIF